MSLEDRLRTHLRATDVELPVRSPDAIMNEAHRRSTRNRVAGVAGAAVLALGAVVGAASMVSDPSVVDLAGTARTTATTGPAASSAEADSAVNEALGAEAEADVASATGLGFGARPILTSVDDGFVGLGVTEAGVVVVRSADGVEFSESPTVGFPPGTVGFSGPLVHAGGLFAAAVIDGDEAGGPGAVAMSTDLANWTVEALPAVVDGDVFVQSLAVHDGTVVAVGPTFPQISDPAMVAFELGLIDADVVERNCGVTWDGPDDPIEIVDCADGEALAVIAFGTDEHAEILAAAAALGAPTEGEIAVWTGGPDRAFELQTLATDGFASPTVIADADGFVLYDIGDGGQSVRRSTDGSEWTAADPVPGSGTQMVVLANVATAVELRGDELSLVSLREGFEESVAPIALGAEFRSGWIAGAVSGPAGAAILVQGAADSEPFPGADQLPDLVTLTVDGYTLQTGLESGPFIVTGPDGSIIHELADGSAIIGDAQDVDGVARFEGPDDERLVILDPTTGEDLFTVTQDEFVAALGIDPGLLDRTTDFPDPMTPSSALLFRSIDGNWQRIEPLPDTTAGAFLTLEAVGDDEILLRVDRIIEPPDELFQAEDGALTDEQQATVDAWEQAQQEASQVVRIPIG